jgi:hydrogenase expression/formation protein HypC
MCLAIPGRVTSIDRLQAVVEMGGVERTIGVALTPEVKVGDYVYVHAGYAISVVDEEVALESLRLLRELSEAYPEEALYYVTGDESSPPAA